MPARFWTDDPRCIVGAFNDHLSSGMVAEFHETIRRHAPTKPRSCLGYISPNTVTSRGALKAIARLLTDPKLSMDAWVCCIAGSGFWAATGRGMAASVMLTINPTAPVHLPNSMESAIEWLKRRQLPLPSEHVQRDVVAIGAL